MNRRLLATFLLPLAITSGYALWSFDHQWRGEWNWTFDTVTGSTVLTGPLIAAMSAWLAMQARELGSVTDSTVRAWAVPGRVALELWLTGLAVYVATAVAAVAVTGLSVNGGPKDAWVLGIGALVLGVCSALGVLAGTLAPYRLTSVLVGLGLFLFGAFGPSPFANLLRHGPTTGSLAGLRHDPDFGIAQAVAIVGLTAAIQAALAYRARGPVHLFVGLGSIGLTLAVVALGALLKTGTERFEISAETPSACDGDTLTVCLAPSNRVLLERTAAGLQRGADQLRQKGLKPPERYEQLLPGYLPAPGAGVITRPAPYGSSSDDSWIWTDLLAPGGCTFWTDPSQPPPDVVFEAQALLEAWIVKGAAAGETAWSPEARTWLSASDSPEARDWAARTFAALRDCQVSDLVLPWDGP